jgi:putative zinc finger/helix-turn-helix YgiT family protein
MICLQCNNESFLPKQDGLIEQEFKGEVFQIQMPVLACSKCGWTTIDLQRADELRKLTGDAYRKKHGLLTSEQIKACRKLIGMTQREFASFLGVGEASVKRWETWLVQEKSSDNLIRLKCEKALLDNLGHKSTQTVWISGQMTLKTTINGISIHSGPDVSMDLGRWDVQIALPIEEHPQMSFCDLNIPEIYGPSPPGDFAERHFLFRRCHLNITRQTASKEKMQNIVTTLNLVR